MRKILYLVKKEICLLKKSIILISFILTVFISAFTGLFSVRVEFVNGFYAILDEILSSYSINASDIETAKAKQMFKGRLYVFGNRGVTHQAYLYNSVGECFETLTFSENEGLLTFNGALVDLNEAIVNKFHSKDSCLISGKWIDGEGQICIEKLIAQNLKLSVGDKLEINGNTYTVKGIYDLSVVSDSFFCFYYYLPIENEINETIAVFSTDAKTAHSDYKKLNSAANSVLVTDDVRVYFEVISPVEWMLNSMLILLLAVIFVILYTLMTIFYRQRKMFVCRLKLLGADYATILGVYLLIAIGLVFVVTVLSAGIGVIFNVYFLNLCKNVFELTFRANFNLLIPLFVFLILSALMAVLYVISIRKIKSEIIAQEIKCN